MCQPGRPAPHGESHSGSPGLAAFQSAKSIGARLRSSTSTRAPALSVSSSTRAVRERAVARKRIDLEVDALPLDDVRVPVGDELCDQRDHVGDPLGGVRLLARDGNTFKQIELTPELTLVLGDDLGLGTPLVVRPGDDLVLDVGDVAHVGDVVPAPDQVPPDRVERDLLAAVAEVRHVVGRRPAHVHRHASLDARDEVDPGALGGVVDAEHYPPTRSLPRAAFGDRRPFRFPPMRRGYSARRRARRHSVRPSTTRQERDGPDRDALGAADRAEALAALGPHRGRDAVAHRLARRGERVDEVRGHRRHVRGEHRSLGGDRRRRRSRPTSPCAPPGPRRRGAAPSSRRPDSARRPPGTACRGRAGRPGRATHRRPRARRRRRRNVPRGAARPRCARRPARVVARRRTGARRSPGRPGFRSRARAFDQGVGEIEVAGQRELDVAPLAFDHDHLPARGFDERGVVGVDAVRSRARRAARRRGTPAGSAPSPDPRARRSRRRARRARASPCRRRAARARRRPPLPRPHRSLRRTSVATRAGGPRRARR